MGYTAYAHKEIASALFGLIILKFHALVRDLAEKNSRV